MRLLADSLFLRNFMVRHSHHKIRCIPTQLTFHQLFVYLRCNLITLYILIGIPHPFTWGFPTKMLCAFLVTPCVLHVSPISISLLNCCNSDVNVNNSVMHLPHLLVSSCLWGQYILLRNLFSNKFALFSSRSDRRHILRSYQPTAKFRVVYPTSISADMMRCHAMLHKQGNV
jgi:hypothetical protein